MSKVCPDLKIGDKVICIDKEYVEANRMIYTDAVTTVTYIGNKKRDGKYVIETSLYPGRRMYAFRFKPYVPLPDLRDFDQTIQYVIRRLSNG